MIAAVAAACLLFVLAALHLLWATGSVWPAGSEADLALRVAGFRGIRTMPPRGASLAVAVALSLAAHVVLAVAELLPAIAPQALYRAALFGLVLVFAARGLAAFTPQWRALTPEQPFARLDRRYYGPLCLLIAVLCAAVLLS